MDSDSLTATERRLVAAYIAPRVREGVLARRRVKTVDKDGNVVKEITLEELNDQLRKRAGIEFDVIPDPERCSAEGCLKKAEKESLRWAARRKAKGKLGAPYCTAHKGGPQALKKHPLLPCVICGEPSTRDSCRAIRQGKTKRSFCLAHFGWRNRGVPKKSSGKRVVKKTITPPCFVCSSPISAKAAWAVKNKGCRPFCEVHKRGITKRCSVKGCEDTVAKKTETRCEFHVRKQLVGDGAAE